MYNNFNSDNFNRGIGFFRPTEPYGEFSNWYMSSFTMENITFSSAEQALMYYKAKLFYDDDIASQILNTSYPYNIKNLGRKVHNFSQEVWDSNKFGIMKAILYAKFSQNQSLLSVLLSTADQYIFENSPYDYIWGVGAYQTGQNLLGKALMEVRSLFAVKINLDKSI